MTTSTERKLEHQILSPPLILGFNSFSHYNPENEENLINKRILEKLFLVNGLGQTISSL